MDSINDSIGLDSIDDEKKHDQTNDQTESYQMNYFLINTIQGVFKSVWEYEGIFQDKMSPDMSLDLYVWPDDIKTVALCFWYWYKKKTWKLPLLPPNWKNAHLDIKNQFLWFSSSLIDQLFLVQHNNSIETIFISACHRGFADAISYLFHINIIPSIYMYDGIIEAIKMGHEPIYKLISNHYKMNNTDKDSFLQKMLHSSHLSNSARVSMVKDIVLQGADIRKNKDYALRYAVRRNYTDIVKVLIEHGADIHFNNDSLLIVSCEQNKTVQMYMQIKTMH